MIFFRPSDLVDGVPAREASVNAEKQRRNRGDLVAPRRHELLRIGILTECFASLSPL
jgi:hypothetical protein